MMKTYIALIRGINVGGKVMKMAELRVALENLGWMNVETYIQSGNVIFQSMEGMGLEEKMDQCIQNTFGYSVDLQIFLLEDYVRIIHQRPEHGDDKFWLVTFLNGELKREGWEEVCSVKGPNEEVYLKEGAIFLYCPDGYGITQIHTNFIEKKLGVKGTTRNWKTSTKLKELAGLK